MRLQSALAQIDLKSGEIVRKIEGVGRMAHGLVFWDRYAVVLDSETPGLNLVDLGSGQVTNEWQVGCPALLRGPSQPVACLRCSTSGLLKGPQPMRKPCGI